MTEQLMGMITQYGYAGLFALLAVSMIGFPMPDETLMTLFGYWSSLGHFSLAIVWICSFAGTMTGMTLSYLLGSRLGHPFLQKYGKWLFLTPERLRKAEKWFLKYGVWAAGFGYFVPGVRHFTCYLSGVSRVGFWRYVLIAGSGAAVWSAVFPGLGYYVGANWERFLAMMEKTLPFVIAAALLAALTVGVILAQRKKPSKPDGG